MVDVVFLVFIGFWYPPPAWKVSLEAREIPQKFCFGGGRVLFSSLSTSVFTFKSGSKLLGYPPHDFPFEINACDFELSKSF